MEKSALLSSCGTFRYRLGRKWGNGEVLVFVMLNPSTADHREDDATIRRCVGFAQSHGYSAVDVVNLYAFRARHPSDLRAAGYPVGPENDMHIRDAVEHAGAACVAWGSNANGHVREERVLQLIRSTGAVPLALGVTQAGSPRHPLMLRSTSELVAFGA